MNEALQAISVLIAALWWGGLVTIDFIETPIRFQTPRLERETILTVGRHLFQVYGRIQVIMGVLLFVVALAGGAKVAALLLIAFMTILSVINAVVFEPGMVNIREAAGGELTPDTPPHARHRQFHQAYTAIDIFKAVFGMMLIVILVLDK